MSEKVHKALALHASGFNCAQAVAGTFCGELGADETLVLKLAGGLGGGLRCGEVCGAVSGAVLTLGLKFGQFKPGDKEAKERCYRATSEFMEKFRLKQNTVLCRELLGYDMRDAGAKDKFPGRQEEVCPKAIQTAVELLEEMGL